MNKAGQPGEGNGPSVEAVRWRLDALERAAVQSHALKDDLGRMLFMSLLRDLRNALDGKVVGMTVPDVAAMVDEWETWLTRRTAAIQ